MKVFLVVLAVWDMAYRGKQITPSIVQEMPSMESCEAVKEAIEGMGYQKDGKPDPAWVAKVRCVQAAR